MVAAGGALATVSAAVLVVAAPGPAYATTGCVPSDPYARQVVSPAAAGAAIVANARFGAATAIADFNNDGYADVAVGAPTDVVGSAASGSVYVFPGSASGVGSGRRLLQTAAGAADEAGDLFGAALTTGDFNNDGYADLAVGVPGEEVGTTKSGGVAVFYGKAAGLTTGTSLTQTLNGGTNRAGDEFGFALAAGDFNRDGYVDLAVGMPGKQASGSTARSGAVAVLKGASGGLAKGWGVDQTDANGTNEAGDRFGAALAAGNVTGSAHTDLVIGAPGEAVGSGPAGAGTISVVPGAASGKGTGFYRNQTGHGGANEANDNMGAALAVGNFDADGYADIAVGLPGEAPNDDPNAGSVLVFPGAATETGTGYWIQEYMGGETLTAGDRFGGALAAADVNRDGRADLLVGAPGKSYPGISRAGAAFLFTGRARDTDTGRALSPARRVAQTDVGEQNEGSDAFGSAVGFGDVDGDGRPDAVVGASGEAPTGQPRSGNATVLRSIVPPTPPALPIQQYSATAAMQVSPLSGATTGSVEYAYADNIGRLMHGHQRDPQAVNSVQWTPIHGTQAFTGQPALAEQEDGRLQVLALNVTGELWSRTQQAKDSPGWGPWVNLGGHAAAPPALAQQADGTLVAFAIDRDGALWALRQRAVNAEYTAWLGLGIGGLTGSPVAVPVAGGIQVFAQGGDGLLRTALFAGTAASGCATVGDAPVAGPPAVVTYPGSKLRVVARGTGNTVLTMRQDVAGSFPPAWSTVSQLTAVGTPIVMIDPVSGKTQVGARAADGVVYGVQETLQGSDDWGAARDWSSLDPSYAAATDPTSFFLMRTGPSNAFVVRTADNLSVVYLMPEPPSSAARRAAPGSFAGTPLPRPPA